MKHLSNCIWFCDIFTKEEYHTAICDSLNENYLYARKFGGDNYARSIAAYLEPFYQVPPMWATFGRQNQ